MERDKTLDRMKGVAIIAMVIGHLSFMMRDLIYSFHMPLFFITAGYVYKQRNIKDAILKDARRLLLPYLIIGLITLMGMFVVNYECSLDGIIPCGVAFLWGAGTWHFSPIFGGAYVIGAIWFLLAMFWCRTCFNILHNLRVFSSLSMGGGIVLTFSALAIVVDHYLVNLPFGLLTGISALMFYYFGYVIRKYDAFKRMNFGIALLCLVLWLVAARYSNLEMANLKYENPMLAVIGAVAASLFLYWMFSKVRSDLLAYIGTVSMAILCIHKTITSTYLRSYFDIPFGWQQILFDAFFIAIGIMIISRIPLLAEIFGVYQWRISKAKYIKTSE